MDYLTFFRRHASILTFGLLLTLFSSFGQTFLLSIFVPQFLLAFTLDTAQFGSLYAAATLASAACLPYFGRLLDRLPLRGFSLAVGLGLALACMALALAPNVAVLFVALLGLRLAGQGLLTLTASTALARVFLQGRGKALSLAGLGYPLGEGLFPIGAVLLVQGVGWRLSWALFSGIILLGLLPAIWVLLRNLPESSGASQTVRIALGNFALLRDGRFYALLPYNLFLPLVLTALFLYQIPLAESRGWSVEVMATAFIGFAVARMAGSLMVGPWIDRWGALRLFPYTLLPICAALVILALGTAPWTALVYLTLAGVSQGISGPTTTALWAEIFGVESLGTTKGTMATATVFSTALGPVLLGGLLKMGVSFDLIVPGCALAGFLVTGTALLARWRLQALSTE